MITQFLYPMRKTLLIALGILVILLAGRPESTRLAADATKADPIVRTYGSEGGYRTSVTSQTNGTLSEEDGRQAAILASHVFQHIDWAQRALDADDLAAARNEVNQGRKAIKAIRSLLPTTTVHTKTSAPDGEVVYESKREVQEDRIPLFEGMLSKRSFAPIAAAKQDAQDQVEVKGVQLVGSETLITEAFADLEYVEGQLERAAKALTEDKADVASKALTMGQVRGVEFRYRKEDAPLAAARDALWLAKRALEENNGIQAQVNLSVARQQLELYRQVLPESKRQDVTQMMTEVSNLQAKLEQESNTKLATPTVSNDQKTEKDRQGNAVTKWWEQLNSWFKKRS